MADSPRLGAHFGPSSTGEGGGRAGAQTPRAADGIPGTSGTSSAPGEATRVMPLRRPDAFVAGASEDPERKVPAPAFAAAPAVPMPQTERTQVMPHARAAHADSTGSAASFGSEHAGEACPPVSSRAGSRAPELADRDRGGLSTGKKVAIGIAIAAALIAVIVGAGIALNSGSVDLLGSSSPIEKEDEPGAEAPDGDGQAGASAPTVGDDMERRDGGDAKAVTPGGGGADNTVDASGLFGDEGSDSGSPVDKGGQQGGSASNGGDRGESGTGGKGDPADNDASVDDGDGDGGDQGGSDAGKGGGVVTESDGSTWTGYY